MKSRRSGRHELTGNAVACAGRAGPDRRRPILPHHGGPPCFTIGATSSLVDRLPYPHLVATDKNPIFEKTVDAGGADLSHLKGWVA
jgi:hypothetical protein